MIVLLNSYVDINKVNIFLDDLVTLTQKGKIIWEIVDEEPKCYDSHKLSQISECIRFACNWESNSFTIIMKNKMLNFEVKFNENPNIIKNLPFVNEDAVQKKLELLFDEIDYMHERNYDFNQLFNKIRNKAIRGD